MTNPFCRLNSHHAPAYCAIGALWGRAFPVLDPLMEAAHRALEDAVPGDWQHCSVGIYNDDPSRTQADILALYDHALTAVTK